MRDYHGYAVKEDGTVISKRGREMKPHLNGKGYMILGLRVDGKSKCKSVHRIVAECYLDNPENLSDVDHIDGDRLNNHISNLRWVTHGDNIKHSYRLNNRSASGDDNANSKYCEEEIIKVCWLLERGCSCKYVSEMSDVSYSTIRKIKCGVAWKCISKHYSFEGSETIT